MGGKVGFPEPSRSLVLLFIYVLIDNSQGSVTSVWFYSWFCDRALHSRHVRVSCECFERARAVCSLVCVPCFMLGRGVQIPELMS